MVRILGENTLRSFLYTYHKPELREAKGSAYMLLLMRFLAWLPLSVLHVLGRIAGRLAYAMPGRYRRRLQANARQAGYSTPAFARRAAAQSGAMIMELPKVWLNSAQSLRKTVSDDNHIVEAALSEGRGILYLTPHLGCFEITARYLTRHGPITVMFRPPRVPALAPVMEAARNTSEVQAVPATLLGVRAFVRALQRGEAVGMLPDQAPSQGDGVWAPFFDRPAYTMTLAGKLARHTGVAVILTAGERLPRGRGWRIHYLRLPEPLPDDPLKLATLVNRQMETLIRRFPEQYLWSYNRYKAPRGAPPPPSRPVD